MRRILSGLGLVALTAVTLACSGASAAPPSGSPEPSAPVGSPADGGPIVVVAKDIAFEPTEITVPADQPIEIVLDNQDEAPHNIAIKDATGATGFKGEIIGRGRVTNAVPALPAGTYTFWCEIHPEMQGTITAE